MLQKYKDFNILISQNKRKKIKYVGMIGKFYLYYLNTVYRLRTHKTPLSQ